MKLKLIIVSMTAIIVSACQQKPQFLPVSRSLKSVSMTSSVWRMDTL